MSPVHVSEKQEPGFDPFAGSPISLTVPSTDAQREVWTATRMGDDASLAFNEAVVFALRGQLDVAALETALGALVKRHESLRATFSPDGLTMLIGDPVGQMLTVHDWRARSTDDRAAAHRALLRRAVAEPFDLVRGPLLRADLARLTDEEQVLVLTAHHLVCDGWSFGVVARELATLYSAERTHTAPVLAPAEVFSDYARTLAAEAASEEMAACENYWIRQFKDEIPALDLPTDRPRPALKTYAAGREDRVLSSALMRRVTQAGSRERASAFATLLAAFAGLMHRLSGQDDLVIGIPVAGQARAGAQSLVGHCVNMLPLRLRVDPSMLLSELLAQTRSTLLDAMEYQQVTLGRLLGHLPIPRDPSRLPLISVIFNVDRGLTPDLMPFEGLTAELESVPRSRESFDLFLNAVELHDGSVRLECQYNTDLYDRDTIARWLESYEQLLAAVANVATQAVAALPILTASDRAAIARCNDTARPLPSHATVAALIEAQTRRSPHAIALEHDGIQITYLDLDQRSTLLARRLVALGVRRDELVALCLERSIEMVVSLVAVLRAGGGYLPLDPGFPPDRLRYMIDDARTRVLITDRRLREELALDAEQLVLVDEHADVAAVPVSADGSAGASAESTAYVTYTSGSTGMPKGVVVTNGSVVNLLESVRDTYQITEQDRVLAITTLSFDIAVSELLLPLVAGARIILASREVASDGLRLARLIDETAVTFIDATPATYRLLLEAGWKGAPHLRVVCTGEAMPLDLARALTMCVSRVWNGYGPTETTVWSTIHEVLQPVQRVLIGRPVANTMVHVLDALMQPVPVGVKGELFIAGAGVARGYLNRPELTRERFLPDALSLVPGGRMYRTGDVVRMLSDGSLECLGRNDSQVKLRGFRIELGEIEQTLLGLEEVAQVSVVVREDRPGDMRLVAYLVSAGGPLSDAAMRAFLKQRLPDYMVPQRYSWLPALPLTPSGKVDRKALPAPADATLADAADFVEPDSEMERVLGALWSEVLGVGRMSVNDDFFALGGHSLLASQLIARLRRDHAIELPFRKIFEMPTIAQLAAHLDASGADGRGAPPAPIPHEESRTTAPLSLLQERLWMLEEMDPHQRAAHSHGAAWRFLGQLDAALLESAIAQFIQRHGVLRTSFHVADGERMQMVAAESPFTLGRRDLSSLAAAERQVALEELLAAEAAVPFDLAHAPLFRSLLVRLADNEHLLFTVRHGMIWDGWSFDIFLNEIVERYSAAVNGRAPELPALPITYADFAVWQREWLAGPEMARQVDFWRQQLAGELQPIDLPTDHPRLTRPAFRGGRVSQRFTGAEVEQLKAFAREHDVTLFMLMFAAYVVLLHRHTGQADLLVGSPVQARTRTETENVVGAFVNTLLLRVRLTPETPLLDLLRQVREVTLASFSNQEMPFELLGSQLPAVRVLFSMQDARGRPARMGGVQVEQVHLQERTASNDLMLWMMERDDHLIAVLNYDAELFEPETAARLLPQLRTLAFAMQRDDTQRVGDLRILPDEELGCILAPTSVPWTALTAWEQFESAATNAPEVIALTHGNTEISYGALLDQSASVAAALRSIGVPSGARVAVALDADRADRLLGVLGTLRAGCRVMLLDPASPPAYLSAQLRDGHASVMLVDEASGSALREETPVPLLVLYGDGRVEPREVVQIEARDDQGLDQDLGSLLQDVRTRLGLSAKDVVVSGLPAWADASLLEILLPVTTGARLVLASQEVIAEPESLASLLESSGATMMMTSLSAWRALGDAGWQGGPSFAAIIVGAPVAGGELADLAGRVGRLFVASGSPETGVWTTMHEVRMFDSFAVLGTPVGGARMFVLDDWHQPQPIGVNGQLHVESLVPGSAAAGTITALRLSSRPLIDTGVRARRRADGSLVLRADDPARIWVEGALVSTAIIERALRADSGVADTAVASHRDAAGNTRLVAHVVRRAGATTADTALRAALRRMLPRHMVPQLFVDCDRIPRDARGGVDRTRLRSPFGAETTVRDIAPPRTESERWLARIWEEALAVSQVGMHDNFFDLGGSSLLCFRVIETAHRETGIRLSPRTFLLGNLEQVAAQLQEARGAPAATTATNTAEQGTGVMSRLKGMMGIRK